MTRKETLEFAKNLWHKIHHPHHNTPFKTSGFVNQIGKDYVEIVFWDKKGQDVHLRIPKTFSNIGEMINITITTYESK